MTETKLSLAYQATPKAAEKAQQAMFAALQDRESKYPLDRLSRRPDYSHLDRPWAHHEMTSKLRLNSESKYESVISATRDAFVQHYGWAIPSREALEAIMAFVGNNAPIEEHMAGGGWWSYLLREHFGAKVTPLDIGPRQESYLPGTVWTDVFDHDSVNGVVNQDAAILLVWPPMEQYDPTEYGLYRSGWFKEGPQPPKPAPLPGTDGGAGIAASMKVGQKLVYVGEGCGDCTGTYLFHKMLHEFFEWIEEWGEIPQWGGLHDRVHHLIKTKDFDLDEFQEATKEEE